MQTGCLSNRKNDLKPYDYKNLINILKTIQLFANDKYTGNHISKCQLIVLDGIIWYYTTVWEKILK